MGDGLALRSVDGGDRQGPRDSALDLDTVEQARLVAGGERSVQQHVVLLDDAVARVRDAFDERAVVREQQQAGALGVEPSDGHESGDAQRIRHEVEDGGASSRVAHSAEVACEAC